MSTAFILAPLGVIGLYFAAYSWRRRRADRAWAAGIAQDVHDAEYLRWLDEQMFSEGSEPS